MATISIIYWRDIPAQIIARAGRTTARRELTLRFTEAIDRAAMRSGARDSSAYLDEWRHGEPAPCGEDLEAEAGQCAAAIEAAYDEARLDKLALAGGWATDKAMSGPEPGDGP